MYIECYFVLSCVDLRTSEGEEVRTTVWCWWYINRNLYTRPAARPPASGPTQYTQWCSQIPLITAGPKLRTGFIEYVYGLQQHIPAMMARPMAKGAEPRPRAPLVVSTTLRKTDTKTKVIRNSMAKIWSTLMFLYGMMAPRLPRMVSEEIV